MTKKDRIKKLLRYLWEAQKIQKPSNIIHFGKKALVISTFCSKCGNENEEIFKEEEEYKF